jgi:hypothetical protein
LSDDIVSLVKEKLGGPFTCYGHCQSPSELRFIGEGGRLVAGHVCPSGYVSRLVEYGRDVDPSDFLSFVARQLGDSIGVRPADLRVATRYGWDLIGGGSEKLLREAYWTQNYGKGKSKDPERDALFLCSSCGSLFIQPLSSKGALCGRCASRPPSTG